MPKSQSPVFELNQKLEKVPSKIEIIKNLLVGEQLEDYDAELELLRKQIIEKKETLDKLITDIKTELEQSIDQVSVDINQRITDVEKNLSKKLDDVSASQVYKKELGNLLSELGDKIAKDN